ncbi:MAG: hypothetical protein ACYS6K_14930 [Planctomycetota bacterium]|jgi:hypothetical protein
MAEEVSPESKVYVKEEIEKLRKEYNDELEKVKSKTTKTLSGIAVVVGLLTCIGVYGLARAAIKEGLKDTTIKTFEKDANDLYNKIVLYEKDTNKILYKLKKFEQNPSKDGYACLGSIKLIWGTETSKAGVDGDQRFSFKKPFDNNCFIVIPSLAGEIRRWDKTTFIFNRVDGYDGNHLFTYVAIGN